MQGLAPLQSPLFGRLLSVRSQNLIAAKRTFGSPPFDGGKA